MGEISKQIQSYWNRRSQDFSAVRRKELASRDADAWQSYIMRYLPQGRSLRILDTVSYTHLTLPTNREV